MKRIGLLMFCATRLLPSARSLGNSVRHSLLREHRRPHGKVRRTSADFRLRFGHGKMRLRGYAKRLCRGLISTTTMHCWKTCSLLTPQKTARLKKVSLACSTSATEGQNFSKGDLGVLDCSGMRSKMEGST